MKDKKRKKEKQLNSEKLKRKRPTMEDKAICRCIFREKTTTSTARQIDQQTEE